MPDPVPPGISVKPAASPSRCTVICATNDSSVLGDHLLASLAYQTEPFELIVLDSALARPQSAAQALNAAARCASGRWLIFAHQDIDLLRPDFLQRFCDFADALPRAGVVGIVGADAGPGRLIRLVNRIEQGPKDNTFPLRGRPIDAPAEVEAVDELLFAVPRDLFAQLPFDELACPHWDLYAVDYCLSARARGWKCFAVPMSLRHLSIGKVRGNYYRTLARLLRKHRGHVRTIFTTCGTWHTWQPMYYQRIRKFAAAGFARLMQLARRPA